VSKVNKQKRGRAYAESVKAHVCLAQSQVLKCAADAKAIDTITGKMKADLAFVALRVPEIQAMLKEMEPEMEKLRKSITIRREVVRNLNGSIFEMGNVIQVTAHKLGIDLSQVEPATDDEPVAVAEVTEKSEAAQLEGTP
jgi:hypothetical protein